MLEPDVLHLRVVNKQDHKHVAGASEITTVRVSRFEEAQGLYTEALREAKTELEQARALLGLGAMARRFGRYHEAVVTLDEALALVPDDGGSQSTPTLALRSEVLGEQGVSHRHLDEFEDAQKAWQAQLALGRRLGDAAGECRAIGNLGMVSLLLGETSAARQQLRERVRLTQGPDLESHPRRALWEAIGHARLAMLELTQGDDRLDAALRAAREALRVSDESRDKTAIAFGHGILAIALARHGDVLAAREHADRLDPASGAYSGERTPLMAFCAEPSTEHLAYIQELLGIGAQLQLAETETGYTALDSAVFGGDEHVWAYILAEWERQAGAKAAAAALREARVKLALRKMFQGFFADATSPAQVRQAYMHALHQDASLAEQLDVLKVVPFAAYRDHGSLPRSSEELQVDWPEAEDMGIQIVVFLSYRWREPLKHGGQPDDENGTVFNSVVRAVTEIARQRKMDPNHIAVWQDYACIDQDNDDVKLRGINSLMLFIRCCDVVVSLVDNEREAYCERAWCRAEIMFAELYRKRFGSGWFWWQEEALQNVEMDIDIRSLRPSLGQLSFDADRPLTRFLELQGRVMNVVD
ncbi:Hypothetical Protein FCC1311_088432 [Hondaea fermentalgiana]|uniref:Uncharacterized protein n=1 Tax=Hondaea fermentalgiana TaxID=2315210 RepID=A0A2R5GS83_9STRA|nr:Hypothetical Protein FCC1311_088432 [Hondaea fermentalgiana]|eukprot:GBG32618.1 Hypothetical Protein FCC1311_088432 [Hondaea fermentalgiana]